jgi:two-component system alkaline phosphatase synthesis response regulator PhoP
MTATTTVLVVDDEPQIARIARDYLQHAGFEVVVARDGPSAVSLARSRAFDLIVLDLALPGLDGVDVTRTLRRESNVPIIMLTARVEESDRLLGLELGADDYITKPFSPRELVARVRAVLRRADTRAASSDVIRLADLTLDVPRLKATRRMDGTATGRGAGAGSGTGTGTHTGTDSGTSTGADLPIDLTPTEFQLLATLARQPGRIFTRAQLLDAVRGIEVDSFERAIDTHIKNIRRKIEVDSRKPRYIVTVYGMGYKCAEA